ncbi:PAS domain-containing protein [Sphingobium sp. AP49]|uniref:PAS domain-containing protein n=1 Tax=Sphingobium sp. AP49 TaxID=1144307 RepID=UPI001EE6877E|nr:PAS domain-containing protein [Sphingobium sp. AP49]WHO37115.1 PAS domain-containing protein [Sphingobium sp. AP49]
MRNFAHWREIGARRPLLITHHGRETHIFMGLDQFRDLAVSDQKTQSPDRLRELAARMAQGLILCRADFRIDHINTVALAMAKRWDRQLEGQILWDALPEFAGTLTEAHARHSQTSGETSAADIPSPFRPESWLHVEAFPFAEGIALLLRDITSDMQRHRLADVKSCILKAMSVHGGVGYVRLSSRGFIEFADASFCSMIGLPGERLTNAYMADLIELPRRPVFRQELEEVLRGEGDRRIDARLLTNDGSLLRIEGALVQLRGTYGTEGAVMVMTHSPTQSANESRQP